MRRLTLASIIAAPALALAATPALAADDGGSSSAEATAAEADGIAVISDTQASSDPSGSSADATSLGVGDQTVAGGEQEGPGTSDGEVATTDDTPVGSVTVGGWEADVDESGHAYSAASLAELVGPDGTLEADVLASDSEAGPDGSSAESSGVHLMLGEDFQLYVLRARQTSDGEGSSALAEFNGEGIGTDEQVDGCEIPGHPLVHLLCLAADASGLHSGDQPAAAVADLGAGDDQLVAGVVLASAREEAAPPAPAPNPSNPEVGTDVTPVPSPRPASLPRTGGGLALLPLGAALLGVGEAMRRFRNRLT